MKRGGPLKRRTPLARGDSRLERRTRLRPISDTRQAEGRIYRARREGFLAERPACEARVAGCTGENCDVHHRAGRHGGNYLATQTWLAVCRHCHDWIHGHPKEARAAGLLV